MKKILTATHLTGESFDVTTNTGQSLRVEGSSAGLEAFGPGPMQLLLIGLATCTAINVIDLLAKMRQPFAAFEIEVAGRRAKAPPRVWTDIALHYRVWGAVDERRLARAIWLSETKLCAAAAMLSKVADITHTHEIVMNRHPASE
ncbi:MAG: OsmC family protein [Acidimicrobiia bacterium]|nr:OsmC family protein [Acidimicrobiia bacterium]